MDFIKNLYQDGLVEQHLDEDAWSDIRSRRIERLQNEKALALYGYLVGIENVLKARNFVRSAESGNSIPKSYVEGYMPIIDMIEDIVAAGPGYIQQLKLVHKRAKQANKN